MSDLHVYSVIYLYDIDIVVTATSALINHYSRLALGSKIQVIQAKIMDIGYYKLRAQLSQKNT